MVPTEQKYFFQVYGLTGPNHLVAFPQGVVRGDAGTEQMKQKIKKGVATPF